MKGVGGETANHASSGIESECIQEEIQDVMRVSPAFPPRGA